MIGNRHPNEHADPVCGTMVDPSKAAASVNHQGSAFYFCTERCKSRFEAEPQRFATGKQKGFWSRYIDRLNRATGGKPPSCCG